MKERFVGIYYSFEGVHYWTVVLHFTDLDQNNLKKGLQFLTKGIVNKEGHEIET